MTNLVVTSYTERQAPNYLAIQQEGAVIEQENQDTIVASALAANEPQTQDVIEAILAAQQQRWQQDGGPPLNNTGQPNGNGAAPANQGQGLGQ